jgi:hypothetical protein
MTMTLRDVSFSWKATQSAFLLFDILGTAPFDGDPRRDEGKRTRRARGGRRGRGHGQQRLSGAMANRKRASPACAC